jgi:hypothetical protein
MGVIENGIYDAHYRPAVRAKNSAVQAIGNASWTSLTFDTEDFDSQALHSTSSNTSRITASLTGVYLLGVNLQFAANTTGVRSVKFLQNGVTEIGANSEPAANTGVTYLHHTTIAYLVSGNYVEAQVYQSSGGSLNTVYEAGNSPIFWATMLSAY